LHVMGSARAVPSLGPSGDAAGGCLHQLVLVQRRRIIALLQDYELQRRLHSEQLQFEQAQTQQAAVQVPGIQTLGTQSQ
ncbi:anti sigma-E factor RseA C-terminal domain-containing protein, partial [Salmonella enterica]